VKEYGGLAIVQDPASAESSHMPQAAIAAARIDKVLPLPEIARFLGKLVSGTEVSL
jgi:two-component system chemotaxis response regulator CheB